MDYRTVAAKVIGALGGKGNISSARTCLTRLRLSLEDATCVDMDPLRSIHGVLGVASRGPNGLEVVFGPTDIEGIAREFALQSGCPLESISGTCATPLARMKTGEDATDTTKPAHEGPSASVQITAGRERSYRAQQWAAIESERLGRDDIDTLKDFLTDDKAPSERTAVRLDATQAAIGRSILVINGPNINMLGLREPDIYGKQDYSTLVRVCKDAARKAGFVDVRCFQSNHEGALVDEIQGALGTFDGIVINPAAYTHTSIAILDALKAVGLPCVEVHISKLQEREDFRQVSYVRPACLETIIGLGLEGYRKAIFYLAHHLGMRD